MRKPLLFLLFLPSLLCAQQKEHLELDSPFASFVEPDFPYFSQTVDAREFGKNATEKNLTSRGLIFRPGNGFTACFDTDLLRWSLIWKENGEGEYLSMEGMGSGSYRLPARKAPAGQENLPKPIGKSVAAGSVSPGWAVGETPDFSDGRERGKADEDEISLGPIPADLGRFSGVRLTSEGAHLEYEISGTAIFERIVSPAKGVVIRQIAIDEHTDDFWIQAGSLDGDWQATADGDKIEKNLRIPASKTRKFLEIVYSENGAKGTASPFHPEELSPPSQHWKETVSAGETKGDDEADAFPIDSLDIPWENPWRRNVRLSGMSFFSDGRIAAVTFDGDVWIISPDNENPSQWTWKRFGSGLHEPLSMKVVDDEIFVFDRNGIIHVQDTDGNGEADFYRNFSNVVPQSAETREFAMGIEVSPNGGFYLAKGGQVGSSRGKLNGTVVEVSKDGMSYEMISTGLRQPFIGIDPETGILTSSDQQGNWKPATPIYRIEKGRYFGFQPAKFKDKAVHPAPTDPPEVWIPHFVNQSGASQVFLRNTEKMGVLNDCLVHIGYNRPEIFKIFLSESRKQGAVASIRSGFSAGPLHGSVNPVDGYLYLCGFEIWGSSGEGISGLFRVRPGKRESWLPDQITAEKRGVLLRFPREIDENNASLLTNYSADRWNYLQTYNYGSGNYMLDGTPGQESLPVTSAYVSKDKRSLFLGIPDMRPSHSLRVTYRVPAASAAGAVEHVFLTVREIEEFDLEEKGFGKIEVNLTVDPSMTLQNQNVEPSAELGEQVATQYGCVACHAAGDKSPPAVAAAGAANSQMVVGPSWNGLWNSRREFTDGSFVKNVDETYLRESILDPPSRVAAGFETEKTGVGMPSYLGVLKDYEIDSVILFIKSLAKTKPSKKH